MTHIVRKIASKNTVNVVNNVNVSVSHMESIAVVGVCSNAPTHHYTFRFARLRYTITSTKK